MAMPLMRCWMKIRKSGVGYRGEAWRPPTRQSEILKTQLECEVALTLHISTIIISISRNEHKNPVEHIYDQNLQK